jgi:hypothetical protein
MMRLPRPNLKQWQSLSRRWNVPERVLGALLKILLLACIVHLAMGRGRKRRSAAGRSSTRT